MGFLIEKNVPDVYVDESRDFQLLSRVLDIYMRGCANRAADVRYQMDLDKCNESLLYAIAYMQGFTTNIYIPSNVLRNICKVFPYCIKRKGTVEAIRTAAYAVYSSNKFIYRVDVDLDKSNHAVTIQVNATSSYTVYLREVLRFLVPAGWDISYSIYVPISTVPEDAIAAVSTTGLLRGNVTRVAVGTELEVEDVGTYKFAKSSYARVNIAKVAEVTVDGTAETTYETDGATSTTYTNKVESGE